MTVITELLDRIRDLEEEIERELEEKRRQWRYRFERNRVRFEREARDAHRRLRTGLLRFLRDSRIRNTLTAPVIYGAALPLAFLDVWFTLYQAVCFPIYGIPKVRRSLYIRIDRHHLGYLNVIEKLNCVYCGYANGLIAYAREIAGRTEQYWCPIKHARRVRAPHERYRHFVDFGDAEGYRTELPRLRREYEDLKRTGSASRKDGSGSDGCR